MRSIGRKGKGRVFESCQILRLVNEGVQAVGMETIKGIKTRIREGIIRQDIQGLGLDDNT